MLDSSDCAEIWFVVTPQNPLKSSESLAHEHDRYDLVQAAIQEQYKFRVTDIEFRMPKPSYTVDTMTYLSDKYPDKEFRLIIGSDNLTSFNKWKNHHILLEEYGLLVYPRPGDRSSEYLDHPKVTVIEAPLLDISASYIRKRLAAGKSVRYLLPEIVITMIKNRHLYGT